jgi:hypothetical protein
MRSRLPRVRGVSMYLEPILFPGISSIEVTVEERLNADCRRQVFRTLDAIPERVEPAFGPSHTFGLNMLYLGNRVRELYQVRQKEGTIEEPYIDPTPTGGGSVHRTVTIKIGYATMGLRISS